MTLTKKLHQETYDVEIAHVQLELERHQKYVGKLKRRLSKIYSMQGKKYNANDLDTLTAAREMVRSVCDGLPLVTYRQLMSSNRRQDIVTTRQVIGYVFYKGYGLTYQSIGDIFSKDHSTILHGNKKIKNELYLHRKYNTTTIIFYVDKICSLMGIDPDQI